MFTTLRLKDSMEDVGKGPLKRGDALYQHAACVHCKRRKLRCSGDRPACVRCCSEGVNKCTYPERKPASPAKRKASAVCKEARARKDSMSPRVGKEHEARKWTAAATESVSSMALESPIHALASAGENDHGHTFPATAEEQEHAMCEFSSLFEGSPDVGMDGGEMVLLEATDCFSLESDTSDGVPALIRAHDLSTPSSTYDLDTYFSPFTPTSPLLDFSITDMEPSKPLSLALPARCPHLTSALTALHATPALPALLAPPTLEAALAANKATLTALDAVLRCGTCSAAPAAALTALVVADDLLASLGRLRAALRPLPHSAGEEDVDMEVPLLLVGDEPLSERGLRFGAYKVESRREWAGVMDGLVGVQLQRLERVLVLVRVRGKGEVRGLVVERLEERLRGVMGRG
ncbi:hypothetical protein PMIN06_007739 [Paraphaeosphaeria minitans]|uniref:Zn(2)-C6 fungal-type domain-containing protein n=1 Tax=Paraphaeosphaeria minitans TaxID=565426 RepID=A0A9P6KMM8_9PLEO|nr:hypothetical protein PMIN01_10681 [Paraphaeosphaeria minitans]